MLGVCRERPHRKVIQVPLSEMLVAVLRWQADSCVCKGHAQIPPAFWALQGHAPLCHQLFPWEQITSSCCVPSPCA